MIAETKSVRFTGLHLLPLIFSFTLGLLLWFTPAPEGIKVESWHLFAVFVMTIIGIILKALPMGAMSVIALSILAATKTLPLNEVLSGFSGSVVWLVVMAFFVAKSCTKSGLGLRIAYHFVSLFGKNSLGLAYGMSMTELVLAPAIPSNTARGGGIIFPIIKSLALAFDSSPEKGTSRKIGAYLIQCAYQANIISSTMFMTATVANPVMVQFAEKMGFTISWTEWALAASLPGVISLIATPLLIYMIYPPELKETPEAPQMARNRLKEMGRITHNEWVTLIVFAFMLVFWIVGRNYGIDPATTALVGVSTLLVTRVLTWRDMISEEGAWDTLVWFSTLVMMANSLNQMGVIEWLASYVKTSVDNVPVILGYGILILGYFYSHYFFASNMAHASSLFTAFAVVGVVAGVPVGLLILSLIFTTTLSACLTHYGTGPGPLMFGAGYVDLGAWWRLGGAISLLYLIIWIGLGSIWWKILGFY